MQSNLHMKRELMFNKAFHWFITNIDHIRLSHNERMDTKLKRLAELRLLITLYKRKFGTLKDDRFNRVLIFAANQLEKSTGLDVLMRTPGLWVLYAQLYHLLRECGLELKGYKQALYDMTHQKFFFSKEMTPLNID